MILTLALLSLTPVAYKFPVDSIRKYSVTVNFDGFVPILGGRETKAEIELGLKVVGLGHPQDDQWKVSSELTRAKVTLDGEELPFTVDNLKTFFPKNTINISLFGKLIKTDAPDIKLPIRLPGLDVKRFPEITYLPVEFPEQGIELGQSFTFKKKLGGSEATYVAVPSKIDDKTIELRIEVTQVSEDLENEALEVVKEAKDATASTHTELRGKGTLIFDVALGAVKELNVKAVAVTQSTDLKDHKRSERTLRTGLVVKLMSS